MIKKKCIFELQSNSISIKLIALNSIYRFRQIKHDNDNLFYLANLMNFQKKGFKWESLNNTEKRLVLETCII